MIRDTSEKQLSLPGFETPFEQNLDPTNRWVKLAEVVPWDAMVEAYYSTMSADQGQPSKPARLIVGAVIIKHRQKWGNEEVVQQIQENPYLQYFCGYSSFTLKQPFAPSLFVEIRKRMGAAVFDNFEKAMQEKFEEIKKAKEQAKKKSDGDDDSTGRHGKKPEKPRHDSVESSEPLKNSEDESQSATEPKHRGKLIIDATVQAGE
jgi:transposase, IS5 family